MCVAVITCHESDFYLIRATASTKNVLRAEALFFGCFHNSFIHCFYGSRSLRWCNVSFLSACCSFPSKRNFGSNVLSSLLSSTVWIFSLFIMPRFWWTIYALIKKTQKVTLNEFDELSEAWEILKTRNNWHLTAKKMHRRRRNSARFRFLKSKNSIVFIILSPANYSEFFPPSFHNFFLM